MMLREKLLPEIRRYVRREDFRTALAARISEYEQSSLLGRVQPSLAPGPVLVEGETEVCFLAQGEYNINYLLTTPAGKFVLRVNTGSQIRVESQIAYEYQALELLKASGVTPVPYYLDDTKERIPYGLLVMAFLPGEPLDYRRDLIPAAKTFARIHALRFPPEKTDFLLRNPGPFFGLWQEAAGYLSEYFAFPQADPVVRGLLEELLGFADEYKKQERYLTPQRNQAVINTEVNSHNFIVERRGGTCHLIDWEKPLFGEPAQDLSMFLIPTTTLWKQNYLLSPQEESLFVNAYAEELCLANSSRPEENEFLDKLQDKIEQFKFFNLLRAISWCAMAWTEYLKPNRPVVNQDTFEKIKAYLEPDFIKQCFPLVFAK